MSARHTNAGIDHPRYLLRLAELEAIERERKMGERRIRAAKFPATKSLDSFDFKAQPALSKLLVLERARSGPRQSKIAGGENDPGKDAQAIKSRHSASAAARFCL